MTHTTRVYPVLFSWVSFEPPQDAVAGVSEAAASEAAAAAQADIRNEGLVLR